MKQDKRIYLSMRKDTVIAHLGSVKKLSELLNCDRRAIYQWGEFVPESREYEIEVKTGGKLLSDYTLKQTEGHHER